MSLCWWGAGCGPTGPATRNGCSVGVLGQGTQEHLRWRPREGRLWGRQVRGSLCLRGGQAGNGEGCEEDGVPA